jgi:hypothetical protein
LYNIRLWFQKIGNRLLNNQAFTKEKQRVIARKHKADISNLNCQVQFLTIPWATQNSIKYIRMIEDIKVVYTKILMIGKCNEVFQIGKGGMSAPLSAKTKEEFSQAKKNIQQRWTRFKTSGA